jgi:hypothetical protein
MLWFSITNTAQKMNSLVYKSYHISYKGACNDRKRYASLQLKLNDQKKNVNSHTRFGACKQKKILKKEINFIESDVIFISKEQELL